MRHKSLEIGKKINQPKNLVYWGTDKTTWKLFLFLIWLIKSVEVDALSTFKTLDKYTGDVVIIETRRYNPKINIKLSGGIAWNHLLF